MKKFLALLMALILALSLSACKKADENLSSNGSAPSSLTTDFKAPQDYAVVLLASINPQVKFYLDKDGIVLALEAVNDDAKEIIDDIVYEGADYQTIIKLFISAANTNGFIKGDAEIEFEIIESKDTAIDTKDILDKASAIATKAASELEITLNVKLLGNIESENENETNTSSETESDNDKTESKPNTDKPATDAHTHSYSKATCTKAATCSCGATNGKATGHDWKAADCKSPKTCKICGTTEGEKGDHNYSSGKCTVCGASNILNPENVKLEKEYVANIYFPDYGSDIYAPGIAFYNDGGYGEGIYAVLLSATFTPTPEETGSRTPITYNGTSYYRYGAGQSPAYVEITDTEIIITKDTDTIKMILMNDGNLKITSSTISDFPVDTILSISWNGLS